ncbi:hypothetical protein [Halorubellus sp. PRR65]|uniref:hypothetical protein n=1 Tax=Halorubellus sp. PRR65 TaxID=3098148 RepID=UPI002B25DD70|nr:hypothetical protein [Halorubellus sp. PRR65]
MKILQGLFTALAVVVILVSLLNDGGAYLAGLIVLILLAVAVGLPFAEKYVIAASKGKWGGDSNPDRREVSDE